MQAKIKYIHRISPKDTDIEGPYPITPKDLANVDAARRWVGKVSDGWTKMPRARNARRTEDGKGWHFFPPDKAGNWHSITIIPE